MKILSKKMFLTLVAVLSMANIVLAESVNNPSRTYLEIPLKEEVGSRSWVIVRNGLKQAVDEKVDGVFIHMNTYGGLVVYADSIRTAIMESPIPVYAFIDKNAASAGALIAIACDSVFMAPGASIGAATVVDQSGEKMPDKYQSYMRATIRATAESHGKVSQISAHGDTTYRWFRDPLIAEAMVDESVVIDGLSDSTHVLTFTTTEAIKHGYSEGMSKNISQIIETNFEQKVYVLKKYEPTLYDSIKGFLLNPAFQAILITLILAGIYFEFQTPGIGFAGAIALICAVLYFAPLYIDGLAANWEIALFVLGVVLLLVEIFVIPGFGIAGIAGFILTFAGMMLALVNNVHFNFEGVSSSDLLRGGYTVISGLLLSIILIFFISHKIGSKGLFKRLALEQSQTLDKGYIGVEIGLKEYVGQKAIAQTDLRPSGRVLIGSHSMNAISKDGRFIEKGETVVIEKFENNQLYVKKEV